MNIKTLYFLLLLSGGIQFGFAQNQQADNIKSVVLKPNITNTYTPYIKKGEVLNISFDDLEADQKDFYYKIEHYNFDWSISNLTSTEYIDGFQEDRIRNFENSFNTLQFYTHYTFQIPNNNTRLKLTGNYKLSVYNEYDELVFSRRFIVYEPKTTVGVAVFKSREVKNIAQKQSVQFTINHPNLHINNPKEDIKVVLLQNNDWNFAITNLKPQFFKKNQLLYKYDKETSFWGGNEFLYFDNKTLRNATMDIRSVRLGEELYNTFLYIDEKRSYQPYTYNPDFNGNFIIRTLNGENADTDADYTWVHFSLTDQEYTPHKKIYVYGNFNNYQLNNTNEMSYNSDSELYECKILLKQGFFNYQYVTTNNNEKLDNHSINGSFYQTENDYTVIVYYKPFGKRYYSVIGIGNGSSTKIQN